MSEQLVIYGGVNIIGPTSFSSSSYAAASPGYVLTYDPTTGVTTYISTASIGGSGSGSTPGGSSGQIQYNNAGALDGVPTLTFSAGTLRATGSFTGSFTGPLTGTASWATNVVNGSTINTSSLATTGSNTFRGNQTISGSVTITSSLNVFGNEFVVGSSGVKLGNVITDVHTITGSLIISGNIEQGFEVTASGNYSRAHGLATANLINTSFSGSAGFNNVTLSSEYGNVTASFSAGTPVVIGIGTNFSTKQSYLITTSSFNGTNTIIATFDSLFGSGESVRVINAFFLNDGNYPFPAASYTHTEGSFTKALGDYSHAEGNATLAIGQNSHAEGSGGGAYADAAHSEGQNNVAIGAGSHAEGISTRALGSGAHSEGAVTIAFGDYSHAEGIQTIASGSYSHAEGYFTTAIGGYSHVEGLGVSASISAVGSHAEGYYTRTNAIYSHTEGNGTNTNGQYSHAEGESTSTLGTSAHSEGKSTTAIGNYSHTEGESTVATGVGAHAAGYFTNALGNYQSVIGQYNISSSNAGAFIIGNGTSVSNRSNLLFASGTQVQISGSLNVSSSISTRFVTTSVTYTASIADSTIDLTGNVTASLYSVVGNTGRQLVIKNGGTGVVTVDAHTTETIDGQLTRRLAARESLLLQSDGVSDWLILNKTPVVMLFYHDSSGISLAANTTYYIGQLEGADPTTTSTLVTRRAIALTSGWITRITRMCSVAGTLSGTEDSTLQIRNVTTNTTVTVSSTIEFNAAAQLEDFTLATPLQVTRGDSLTIIITTGNWLTVPNSVRQTFNVLIE
jgi:hypothetical protein